MILLFTDVGATVGYGKYAGTYKLASDLRANGYPTQVIDHFRWLGISRLKKILDKFMSKETLFVGISTTLLAGPFDDSIWGMPEFSFIEFCSYIKKINKNTKIVVGGPKISFNDSWNYVDYAVVGKADNAIIKIAQHLDNGSFLKFKKTNFTKIIDGNDYFYDQNQYRKSQILYEKNDIIFDQEALPIEVARGCIFKCSFCFFDLIGKKIGDWTKTEDVIVDELTRNYEKFGVTNYMISDELINESIEKLRMMERISYKLPFDFKYTAFARADLLHRYPDMIPALKNSGAVALAFGIETFHPKAGKLIGKGMDPNKIKDTLSKCKELWKDSVLITSNFIIGLPEETEESILETIKYLEDKNCPIDAFELHLLEIKRSEDGQSGNKIGDDPEKYGYTISSDRNWVSNIMTKKQAREFHKSLLERPFIKNKRKFSSATYIGRILSLGYTIEDVFNMIRNRDYAETIIDVRLKGNLLKEKYYNELMKL